MSHDHNHEDCDCDHHHSEKAHDKNNPCPTERFIENLLKSLKEEDLK